MYGLYLLLKQVEIMTDMEVELDSELYEILLRLTGERGLTIRKCVTHLIRLLRIASSL